MKRAARNLGIFALVLLVVAGLFAVAAHKDHSPTGGANITNPVQLGLAVPGGDAGGFRTALTAGLHVRYARLYANGVPASYSRWPDAVAAHGLGLTDWLSLWIDPASLAAGRWDAALAAFAGTLPAGTRLTLLHEPSHKKIGTGLYTAAFNRGSRAIHAGNPLVLTGPIDVQANIIKARYLDGLDPALVQYVGLDAYDGIGQPPTRSFQQVTAASFARARQLFPHAGIGWAEFGTSRAAGWAQWVAAAMTWGRTVGADTALLFTSDGPYRKTPAELHQLAVALTPVGG